MAVLDMLTPAVKRDNLHRLVTALIFSFIIYTIYAYLFNELPVLMVEKTVGDEKQYGINFISSSVLILLLISFLISITISVSVKYDLHMKLLRRVKITDRTSRSNLWFDIFTDIKSYVIINFEDGRRLFGWPEYFSDDPEDKSLFLCQASWIDDDGSLIDLDNRGILITPNEKIDTIEFAKLEEGKNA